MYDLYTAMSSRMEDGSIMTDLCRHLKIGIFKIAILLTAERDLDGILE